MKGQMDVVKTRVSGVCNSVFGVDVWTGVLAYGGNTRRDSFKQISLLT